MALLMDYACETDFPREIPVQKFSTLKNSSLAEGFPIPNQFSHRESLKGTKQTVECLQEL